MPDLYNDRWWFTAEDGRASNDFGADPRPSGGMTAPNPDRPRDVPAPIGPPETGTPFYFDNRRTSYGIVLPIAGAGLIVSGRTVLYAYSLSVFNPAGDLPASARACFVTDGRLAWIVGTVTAAAQTHSGIVGGHAGVLVNNLGVGILDVVTGVLTPPESYPGMLIYGTAITAAME